MRMSRLCCCLKVSIPIEKAMSAYGDVLLAYEMNGEPLTRDHGYPLRAIVPGTTAARSVKWVYKVSCHPPSRESLPAPSRCTAGTSSVNDAGISIH